METKQKLSNLAKRYLTDDEEIMFKDQFGDKHYYIQINGKLMERTIYKGAGVE